MRTRGLKIVRDSLANKSRSILVIMSIFIGVFGIAVLTTMGQLLTRQLNQDLDPSEMAMLRVFLNTNASSPIDNDEVFELLRSDRDVTAVEGQAVYQFGWRLTDDKELRPGDLYAYSEIYGQIEIEPIRLLRGRFPKSERREIAIEKRMADKYDLAIGDSIIVNSITQGEEEWKIVGIVFQSYIYFGDGDASSNVYMNYPEAQSVVGFAGYSSIYARFSSYDAARQASVDFRKIVNQQTPYTIVLHLVEDPHNNPFVVGVHRFRNVLMFIAVTAMIVSSFLVTNVLNIIIAEQRRQIGSLKAIGATRFDIFYIYLGMTLLYGVIGTILGLIVGGMVGERVAVAAAPIANTVLTNTSVPLLTYILAISLGIGIPLLAAFIPIWNGSRTTIHEAMSDFGIDANYRPSRTIRWLHRLNLPFTITQAISNVLRRKGRLALSFFSLTIAAAAFMGMLTTFMVLNGVIHNLRENLNYAVNLDLGQLQVLDVVNSLIGAQDEVRAISPGIGIQLEVVPDELTTEDESALSRVENIDANNFIVTAIDTSSPLAGLEYIEGDGWTTNPQREGIVISTKIATRFEKKAGDTIYLRSPQETKAFEIIGIADYPIETAFMEWQQLADFVGEIRDAPTPNSYWEPIAVVEGDAIQGEKYDLWALGIDETLGAYLYPSFNSEELGVLISRQFAEIHGYGVGDEIKLQSQDDSLLSTLIEPTKIYPILAVIDIPEEQMLILASNIPTGIDLNEGVVAMYWADLADLVGLDYSRISPVTYRFDLSNPENSITSEVDLSNVNPVSVYTNEAGFADRIAQTILSVGIVMNLASLLMAVVGGIGLLTITLVGIWERQREIGVMRTVGATDMAIFLQFLTEGIVLGFLAWLVGVPLSYLIARLLLDNIPFHEVLRFDYSMLAPIAGLVGMLIVTILATLYPAIRATQRTVSEILRYG